MMLFSHIFKTWALAQMLHPIVFLFYLFFFDSMDASFWIGGLFFVFIFSLFASIPSLLVSWFLLYVISNAALYPGEKFFAWIASILTAIFLNFLLLTIYDGTFFDNEVFKLMPPSLIAAILSILIRTNSFFEFQSNYDRIEKAK